MWIILDGNNTFFDLWHPSLKIDRLVDDLIGFTIYQYVLLDCSFIRTDCHSAQQKTLFVRNFHISHFHELFGFPRLHLQCFPESINAQLNGTC